MDLILELQYIDALLAKLTLDDEIASRHRRCEGQEDPILSAGETVPHPALWGRHASSYIWPTVRTAWATATRA